MPEDTGVADHHLCSAVQPILNETVADWLQGVPESWDEVGYRAAPSETVGQKL